jgi:hypothetical protein
MNKKISMEELLPFIEEAFENGKTFTIPITGTSMLPLLVQGRDTVTLKKIDGKLKKGDLPLYRRNDGAFVLHRIIDVLEDGSFIMCGDNQFIKEYGITDGNLIGVVTEINRDGKVFSADEEKYLSYVNKKLKFFGVRYPLRRLRYLLHKVKVKLKK